MAAGFSRQGISLSRVYVGGDFLLEAHSLGGFSSDEGRSRALPYKQIPINNANPLYGEDVT